MSYARLGHYDALLQDPASVAKYKSIEENFSLAMLSTHITLTSLPTYFFGFSIFSSLGDGLPLWRVMS